MRKYAPLGSADPLVTQARRCYVCTFAFQAGDEVTLLVTGPANQDEGERARAGGAYNAVAEVIHWHCRPVLSENP